MAPRNTSKTASVPEHPSSNIVSFWQEAGLKKSSSPLINQHFKSSSIRVDLFGDQIAFANIIQTNDVTIAIGGPGCGKTFTATAVGIKHLLDPTSTISKVVYVRKPVDVGGKTPPPISGNYAVKNARFAEPLYDSIRNIFDERRATEIINSLMQTGKATIGNGSTIEVVDPSAARGMTFANSLVIVDESASMNKDEIKTIMGRRAVDSKMVWLADPDQADIKKPAPYLNASFEAVLNTISGISKNWKVSEKFLLELQDNVSKVRDTVVVTGETPIQKLFQAVAKGTMRESVPQVKWGYCRLKTDFRAPGTLATMQTLDNVFG